MRSYFFSFISLILIFGISSCYKEEVIFNISPNEQLELPLILAFNHRHCFFDVNSNSLCFVIPKDSIVDFSPFIEFQEHSTILINDRLLTNNSINNLGLIEIKKKYSVRITTKGKTKYLSLRFTTLPVLRVVTRNKIADEPKSLAQLTINSPINNNIVTSFIGIELRGASSQFNPKKSYGFTFLQNKNLNNRISKSLLGCKKNESWILDAVYNDQAKLRNKLSFEIWKNMNPTKQIAIKSQFVELYLNNDYQGLYCLNEQINAEQLDLLNSTAVLYKSVNWKGGPTFEYLTSKKSPKYTDFWDGWVQKYPNPTYKIKWQPLHNLRNWVINKTDEEFVQNTLDYIDLENIIDYYLFINLIGANDNHGKNMIWMSPHDGAPFSIIPWDLDTSWGRDWDAKLRPPSIVRIHDNQLFKRLFILNSQNFRQKLKAKWNHLRQNIWSNSSILSLLDNNFRELNNTDAIQQENIRWNKNIDLQQEHLYMQNWVTNQLNLLDIYFNEIQN